MIKYFLKLLLYSAVISQVKAQFGALQPLVPFGNLPILTQLFTTICNTAGRQNEIFSACGSNACQNTCRNPTLSTVCTGACVAGCVCAAGYIRNSANVCVLPQNCDVTPSCSGVNEAYSVCGDNGCQPTCSNQNVGNCNPICSTPRCICLSGYVRNSNGVCVLPTSCVTTPTCTQANEIYSACGNDGCQRSCFNLVINSCNPVCSGAACICAPGYVRNIAGVCVLPSLCPVGSSTCTGQNEIFSACGNDGCQRSCNRLIVTSCAPICSVPGCICATGFVRNNLGACVLPLSCAISGCSGNNEIFSLCGNDGCQRSCTRLDVTGCFPSCALPGCICASGFVRSSTGACILPTSCPATTTTCTRANEFYSACGNDGCQRSCTRLDVSSCVRVCSIPACVCSTGYVRDSSGNCILPSACPTPSCTRANEIVSTCGNDGCQRSCTRLSVLGCQPVCSVPGCICATGFVRNAAGDCVSPVTCPSTPCPGLNEMFSTCGNDGCQKTCTRLDATGCTRVCTISGCICATGYVRNIAGACVLPAECPIPTCSRTNEVFSACGEDGCRQSCSRLDTTGCSPVCSSSGCICRTGYVKNLAGDCVAPSSCPTVTCGTNEVFSACGNDGCQRSCTRLDVTGCNPVCSSSGCICAPGYVKNAGGQCVDASTCPTIACTGTNEIFSTCGNDGCQTSCTRLDTTGCTRVCVASGCVCASGFVRDAAGTCVSPNTCPTTTCSGTNEVFSQCGNDGCQKSCSRLEVTGCNRVCTASGCICATGFVRNAQDVCVAPTSCPAVTCTGVNEIFSTCGNDGCQRSCSRLDATGCVRRCTVSGCICMSGFVRDAVGTCVSPTSCPPVECNAPNEIFSACGNDGCQKSCTRLDVTGCSPVCNLSGCICKSGYVRNSLGVCVTPNECPPIQCARSFEVYSPCGDDGCQKKCSRLDVTGCTRVCTMSGCICQSGYVRNAAGNCILPQDCPTLPPCSGSNEFLSTCGNDGCQRTCMRLDVTGCTSVCGTTACVCSPGYVRNAVGACVLPSTCPSITCPTNEVFSECGNDGCQKTCSRLSTTGCTRVCTASGCICASGYVRNLLGVCVLPTACPAVTCTGTHEIFSECGNNGCQKSCSRLDVTGCVPVCTASGCICDTGYVRDNQGVCVLPSSCPSITCTGTNEVYSQCGDDGCQRTCTKPDVTGCNKVCTTPGCICGSQFVRNSAGQCVAVTSCPQITCTGSNEEPSSCGDDGCQRSCRRLDTGGCTRVCRGAGCICMTGYVRNDDGACVDSSACTTVNCPAPNEGFSACGENGCQLSCMRQDSMGCIGKCTVSGCVCNLNYVRDSRGVCILKTTCPIVSCPDTNEVFAACADDGCQKTCARQSNSGCVSVCKASGCVCTGTKVRNAAGVCVESTLCPIPTCPNGETFSQCGETGCTPSCANPTPNTGTCSAVCVASGCVCDGNTKRNSLGQCVTNCPTCTGANEMFSHCAEANCHPQCTAPTPPVACTCQTDGCVCRPGYFRTTTGICVLPTQC